MRQIIPCLLISVLATLTLSACASPEHRSVMDRLEARTAEAAMSYSFAANSTAISTSEQNRIYRFLSDLGLTSQDVVIISIPKAGTAAQDVQRRRTLSGVMASHAARVRYVQDKDFRHLSRAESRGVIRVVRVTGVKVDCSDVADMTRGCASARNLAAMLSDPNDLVLPAQGNRYVARTGRSQGQSALSGN